MSSIALLLAIILGSAAAIFYAARDTLGQGSPWAADVCSLAPPLCAHAEWVGIAAAVSAALYIVLKVASAARLRPVRARCCAEPGTGRSPGVAPRLLDLPHAGAQTETRLPFVTDRGLANADSANQSRGA